MYMPTDIANFIVINTQLFELVPGICIKWSFLRIKYLLIFDMDKGR